jgi:hypothetical protein
MQLRYNKHTPQTDRVKSLVIESSIGDVRVRNVSRIMTLTCMPKSLAGGRAGKQGGRNFLQSCLWCIESIDDFLYTWEGRDTVRRRGERFQSTTTSVLQ